MARRSREQQLVPGALVHVIIRFVDGRFVLDDEGRARYLELLARAMARSDWALIAYALMSSHIHLAFLLGETDLRSWALSLHVRFAQWLNRRLRSSNPKVLGHVFADRPSTFVMCPSRARYLVAYQHRNPLAAGVVSDPCESTWTSHRAYLGWELAAGGLDVALGLELARYEDTVSGRRAFGEFVARTEVRLGDVNPMKRAPTTRSRGVVERVSPVDIVCVSARVMSVPLEELVGDGRTRRIAGARRVALLAGLELGYTAKEMAAAMQVTESGASRLLSRPHDECAARAEMGRVLAHLGARV